MPVVYIDVLFGINLFINYIMLRAAGAICKRHPSRLRSLGGAALGALYAAAMFFPDLSLFYSAVFKALASGIIVAAAFPVYGLGEFFCLLGCFYGVNLLFGGIAMGIFFFTELGANVGAIYSNGIIYMDIPAWVMLAGAAVFYALLSLGAALSRIIRQRGIRHKMVIELSGRTAVLTALADTGNILVDPVSHAPVIVAELDALKELFDYSLRQSLSSDDLQAVLGLMAERGVRARLIPFSSVGNSGGMMLGFVPDRAALRIGGGLRPMDGCVIGVCTGTLSADKSYDALYNPN